VSLAAALAEAVEGREVPGPLLEAAFGEIADGEASAVQVAALLTALRTRGETPREMAAVARALRARADTAPLADSRTVDTCGTGGDGRGTFNISTAAALVVAGAGVPVAKHGNRAASSKAGSFDVLEALGVHIELSVEAAARVLAETGFGPFFARRAHPAMRHVAPVRAELGFRTVMNLMGPLLNPVGARRQLLGVYDASRVEPVARVLAELGSERALVVHGADGLDEITTTDVTDAAWLEGGTVLRLTLEPEQVGLPRARPEDLAGGDAEANAAMLRALLEGERGPRRDVVLANAGAALQVAGEAADWAEGVARAGESLDSGAARRALADLVEATRRAGEAAA